MAKEDSNLGGWIFLVFAWVALTAGGFAFAFLLIIVAVILFLDTQHAGSWRCESCTNEYQTEIEAKNCERRCSVYDRGENNSGGYSIKHKAPKGNSVVSKTDRREVSLEEVKEFWDMMNQQKLSCLKDTNCGASISTDNFSLFRNFMCNTDKELLITTNVFSDKTLIELLAPVRDKKINVTIITAREKDKKYNAEKFFAKYNLGLKIIVCSKNHSKIMVRDKSKILIGSSNLDDFSLHQALETNIVSQKKENVEEAYSVIRSFIEKKDVRSNNKNSDVVYSGSKINNLPLIIKNLLLNEKSGLNILMPLQLFNVEIVKKVDKWNVNNVKTTINLSNRWAKGEENAISKKTYMFLKNSKYGKNIDIKFNNETIHSKVYQFESQKRTLISSLNMTPNSWSSLFEAGMVSKDLNDFTKIQKKIASLEHGELRLGDMAFETSASVAVWKQRPTNKETTSVPWDMPEVEGEFRFEREVDKIYFKKPIRRKNNLINSVGPKVISETVKDHIPETPKVSEDEFKRTHPELFDEKTKYVNKFKQKGFVAEINDGDIEIIDKDGVSSLFVFDSFNSSKKRIKELLEKYTKIYFISDGRIANTQIIRESEGKIVQMKENRFKEILSEF